jgi:hypothetical protein
MFQLVLVRVIFGLRAIGIGIVEHALIIIGMVIGRCQDKDSIINQVIGIEPDVVIDGYPVSGDSYCL